MRTREVKTCTHANQSQNMLTCIYASCVHVFTRNFMKIDSPLLCHTLSFWFHKDLILCCSNICKITLNTHARDINASAHIMMRLCAFLLPVYAYMPMLTKKITCPLLCYDLKLQGLPGQCAKVAGAMFRHVETKSTPSLSNSKLS